MTDATYAAAWVPYNDPGRPWDEAAELAIAWVLEQAEHLEQRPVLVTTSQDQWHLGPDTIRQFARTNDTATARGSKVAGQSRPVLAYAPGYGDMYRAISYANGGALAVVESQSDPLIGWAMEVQAMDLLSGQATVDSRTGAQRADLESIHDYGNNGWTRGFGADRAAMVLRAQDDILETDVILGHMLARGHDELSLRRLAKIIEQVR
jgi:hypothetical protein